jgi:hypothetical protein
LRRSMTVARGEINGIVTIRRRSFGAWPFT